MKSYHKLSKYKKYIRVKRIWPLYVIGTIIFYWKLNFWTASILTAILITITLIQLHFLKKDINITNKI